MGGCGRQPSGSLGPFVGPGPVGTTRPRRKGGRGRRGRAPFTSPFLLPSLLSPSSLSPPPLSDVFDMGGAVLSAGLDGAPLAEPGSPPRASSAPGSGLDLYG